MARQKKGRAPPAPAPAPAPAAMQETFETELKELAAKAQEQTSTKLVRSQLLLLLRWVSLLVLGAVASNLSQLSLAPVYGAIPAAVRHSAIIKVASFVGWSLPLLFRQTLPHQPMLYLPVVAATIPIIQVLLCQQSQVLGFPLGPVLTEAVTILPLLTLTAASVAAVLEDLDLSGFGKSVADSAPGILSYLAFRGLEVSTKTVLNTVMGSSVVATRAGLQLVLPVAYAALAPSQLLVYAVPGFLCALLWNPHLQAPWTTAAVQSTLATSGWSLLARSESLTGYISVIESPKLGYRVLRCDHSLLGGEWIHLPQGGLLKEPIYAVFTMLEAVRLVEAPEAIPDATANALVIGAGIGTTPAALISHGINTTIVEIDPLVYQYAVDYFSLPQPHHAVIMDAVKYAEQVANSNRFDYIVHDVFTGGAEPPSLFTHEFLTDLKTALKPGGVISILSSWKLVMRTIGEVFPSCRAFRELPPPSEEELAQTGRDFTNMVVFCTKSKAPVAFRAPTEDDFLGSNARRMFLLPKHEIVGAFGHADYDEPVLSKQDTSRLTKGQEESAIGHWAIMRGVVPPEVWENW